MKKIILMFLITTSSFAQDKFIFTKDGFTDYVVTEVKASSSDIYSKAINWIKETYKSPDDDVLLMTMENEKIRFQGYKSGFYCVPYAGSEVCSNATYIIEISIKDGRYKLDPIEFKLSNSAGSSELNMNDTSIFFNKKGELKKGSEKTPKLLEEFFNGLNNDLLNYVTAAKKNDW